MQSRLNLTDEKKKYLTANLTILQQRSSKHVVANTKNQLGGPLRSLYKRVPSLEQRKKETNCMPCSSIEQELLLSAFLFPPTTTTPFFGASSSSLSLYILNLYLYTYIICKENRHIREAHWLVCCLRNLYCKDRFFKKKCVK